MELFIKFSYYINFLNGLHKNLNTLYSSSVILLSYSFLSIFKSSVSERYTNILRKKGLSSSTKNMPYLIYLLGAR